MRADSTFLDNQVGTSLVIWSPDFGANIMRTEPLEVSGFWTCKPALKTKSQARGETQSQYYKQTLEHQPGLLFSPLDV